MIDFSPFSSRLDPVESIFRQIKAHREHCLQEMLDSSKGRKDDIFDDELAELSPEHRRHFDRQEMQIFRQERDEAQHVLDMLKALDWEGLRKYFVDYRQQVEEQNSNLLLHDIPVPGYKEHRNKVYRYQVALYEFCSSLIELCAPKK